MELVRVFPRKTNATPDDKYAFTTPPPKNFTADEVHISVTFSYDIEKAKELFKVWDQVSNKCTIGGPAINDPGGEFIPGRYLKKGYIITSRGCPNKCWFCDVHKREGGIREIPITEGWNLLDSNILACSDEHISEVFRTLKQSGNPPELTGGLEARIMTDHHVSLLWDLRPTQMFFAYDTPDDLEPLLEAGKKLRYANFTRSHLRCYVLIGFPKDTKNEAKKRLLQTWEAGFLPMAMLWKNKKGTEDKEWRRFQRLWARVPIIKAQIKQEWKKKVEVDLLKRLI